MLYVNDFCLLFKEISPENNLPLVRIVIIDPIACTVCDRNGSERTVQASDLLKFDNTYSEQLWDEIVTLERQILFLQGCLRDPSNYFIYRNLVVKQVDKNKIITLKDLDNVMDFNISTASRLDEARLNQLGDKLLKFEEEHAFLTETLEFLN